MPSKDPAVRRATQKRHRERNKERLSAAYKVWCEQNAEKKRKGNLDWCARNKDKQREVAREWARRNKDAAQKYKRTHPQLYAALAQARRARKREQFVEKVMPNVVYTMYGGMCGICKEFIVGEFHVDHIKPLSKGGLHAYINCQPAHPTCNLQKGATWPWPTPTGS